MITAAVLSIALGAAPSIASTPASWAKLQKQVAGACLAMSGLARPELLAQRISFSDVIPVEARMIRGYDNAERYKRLICLYDRRTGRTEVQSAPNWNGAATRP